MEQEPQNHFYQMSPERNNALIAYALLLVGLLTGISWILGGIWALIKRPSAINTQWESHYQNLVTVFCWGLGLFIVGIMTWTWLIGIVIVCANAVWCLFRLIKGITLLVDDKPYV